MARSCRCILVRAERRNHILHSLQQQYQPSSASNVARHLSNLDHGSRVPTNRSSDASSQDVDAPLGSKAFVDCDRDAIMDLFHKFAVNCDVTGKYMDKERLGDLLRAVGENPDEQTIDKLFALADSNGDGAIELEVSDLLPLVRCKDTFVAT